jgi:hypothetical protein
MHRNEELAPGEKKEREKQGFADSLRSLGSGGNGPMSADG